MSTPSAPADTAPAGSEPPTQQPPAAPEGQQPPDSTRTPPWERNGTDPDPNRVWQLAENRRLENERLRAERDRLAQDAEQRRQAELSESQRAQEAAQAAERRAQEAEAQALRYQIAAQFRIEPEDFDLLGSGSREEMENRAQRLSAHYAARQQPAPLPPPGSGRPVEDLRPGASPADQPSEDDLVYERLYGPTRK